MTKPSLPSSSRANRSRKINSRTGTGAKSFRPKVRRVTEKSDVLISAVLSTYMLTHLHHVLQRAEYSALKDGRTSQASNYAQLRKVLCMDARSMQDAFAPGLKEEIIESCNQLRMGSKVA